MDKKELSEAISEGIMEGFWKPIAVSMLCLIAVGAVIIGISVYQNYKQQECIESGKCIAPPVIASIQEGVYCYVVVGDENYSINIYPFTVEGYQEANAKFEQLKLEIEADEWVKGHNWSIKRLSCN